MAASNAPVISPVRDAAPYPFDRLARIDRERAGALRRWARALPLRALALSGPDARTWLGAPLLVHSAPPGLAEAPVTAEPSPSVVLEHRNGRAGLTLEARVAVALVERTLGGEDAPPPATAGPLSDLERGVLAYALARLLGDSGWRLGASYAYAPAMIEALGDGPLVRWPLDVTLGAVRGALTLWLPADGAPAPAPIGARPSWVDVLPIAVRAVAGEATLEARAIAALAPGDVVIADRLDAERPILRAHEWEAATRRSGDGLVVESIRRGIPIRRGRKEGVIVTERSGVEAMGETPVTLALELARFELPLADVAALAPGEVIATGAAIGSHVTLRAGDRVIATAELVDVEGEIGVRIVAVTP